MAVTVHNRSIVKTGRMPGIWTSVKSVHYPDRMHRRHFRQDETDRWALWPVRAP